MSAAVTASVRAGARGHRRLLAAAAACWAAFAALAFAVSAGWLTRIDQAAIDHTMPWHGGTGGPRASLLGTAFPVFHRHPQDGHVTGRLVAFLVTWAASAGPASILTALCLLLLWRRGRRGEALAWGVAYAAANGIEILCKAVLTRPPLYFHSGGFANHVDSYDDSFPSGHTVRALLLALIAAAIVRRLLPLLALWAAGAAALLDVGAYHVPSDIAAALLLGAGFVLLVGAYAPAARMAAAEPGS